MKPDKSTNVIQTYLSIIYTMLLILLLIISFLPANLYAQSIINANYYFDAVNGNDNNSGTSPSQAWKTASKFNSTNFPPGSVIAFRDSMIYEGSWQLTESGTSSNRIKMTNWYGPYSQKYPEFILEPKRANWSQTSGYTNVWETSAPNNFAVWFIFADSSRWGVRESGLATLDREFETYYASGKLYVYSPENPTGRYLAVRSSSSTDEQPPSASVITLSGSYLTVQYLSVGYSRGKGISINLGADFAEVLDCNAYYCGKSIILSAVDDGGDGIYILNSNAVVKRCTTYENAGHGYYVWGGSGSSGQYLQNVLIDSCVAFNNHHTTGIDINSDRRFIRNVTVRNCLVYSTIGTWFWRYHWVGFNPSDGIGLGPGNIAGRAMGNFVKGELLGLVKNIYFYNNIVINTPGASIQTEGNCDSIYIYNNTFVQNKNSGEGTSSEGTFKAWNWALYTNTSDGHLWIRNNVAYVLISRSTNYIIKPMTNGASNFVISNNQVYRADGSSYLIQGFNLPASNTSNPNFTNISPSNPRNYDLYPLQNSPLIDAGTNLGSPFNVDRNGITRPQGNLTDIGAIEFFAGGNSGDNTPPEVIQASLIDSITLSITFSESLNQQSATNINNYSIDNGINVISAQLNNNTVRLTTSLHSPGFYTVTVSNVTDLAGNIISAQHNSANYGYNPDPLPGLLKITPFRSLASSVPEPLHIPEKTYDGLGYNGGDPSSRWAAQGLPQWIVYDLGDIKMLNKTRIQFYRWLEGRVYTYSILSSTDSIIWVNLRQNIQSQNVEWNEVNLEPTPARYVKILITANNENDWANIWETEIYGQLIISNNNDQQFKPTEFLLEQNYPNPFNPSTSIQFSVGSPQKVTLKVFDVLGSEVATLVDEYKERGSYKVEFDASGLPSGIYIYRLQSDAFINTKKMVLLR